MFDLLVMRHAKSDWNNNFSDIERPLNNRGEKNALLIGKHLNEQGLIPDKILLSSAQRTQQTAQLMRNYMPLSDDDVIIDKSLYLASVKRLLDGIRQYARDGERLMILAHNPGIDDLVTYLAGDKTTLTAEGKLMVTAAVAVFQFATIEHLSRPGSGDLQQIIRPKELL